jgi:hypothetical protein
MVAILRLYPLHIVADWHFGKSLFQAANGLLTVIADTAHFAANG